MATSFVTHWNILMAYQTFKTLKKYYFAVFQLWLIFLVSLSTVSIIFHHHFCSLKFYLYFTGTTEVHLCIHSSNILIDLSCKLTNVKRKISYLNFTSRTVSDLSFLKTCTEDFIFRYEIHFLKDTQIFSETRRTDFFLLLYGLPQTQKHTTTNTSKLKAK